MVKPLRRMGEELLIMAPSDSKFRLLTLLQTNTLIMTSEHNKLA